MSVRFKMFSVIALVALVASGNANNMNLRKNQNKQSRGVGLMQNPSHLSWSSTTSDAPVDFDDTEAPVESDDTEALVETGSDVKAPVETGGDGKASAPVPAPVESDAGKHEQKNQQYDPNDPAIKKAMHEDTPFLIKVQMPAESNSDIANADPNTVNLLKPKNQCKVCQKFFAGIVFPKLISGTFACQPKDIRLFGVQADGPAFKGFCQLWTANVHGDKRGSLQLMVKDLVTQDGNLGTDPSCTESLALDACIDMGQCTETPCEVCQEKVSMAATLALNSDFKGVLPVMEHLETMCNDATNPEVLQQREKVIQAAKDNAAFNKKYQNGYNLFNTKKIQDDSGTLKSTIRMNQNENCASLSSVEYAKHRLQKVQIKWGEKKSKPSQVKEFCTSIGFCRDQDEVKIPNRCQLPEETKTTNGDIHEGAQENWVKHNVAKKLTYKYTGKISQKGQQTRQIKTKKEKTEEKKDTWVTADVIIQTSGSPVDGMARFQVQVDNAQVGTYDQHNKWTPRDLEESDFPYFFSRNANGQVTHVHHDPAEKYFALQLKHEIAKMFSTDLKGDELFNKASASFVERGESDGGGSVRSTHQTTVLLEKTATHVVVRKTSSGISHHRVFAGQGDGLATLHHRGEATIMVDKNTGDIEESTKQDHVQTETDEVLDDNNKGPNENCHHTSKDPLCTSAKGGPRGESVDSTNKESLSLVSRVVYNKNSHGAQTIGNFLEISMHRLKTVSLWDEGHIPTRAEQQEEIQQHLKHPNAKLPTTPKLSNYVDYLLNEKTGDRDHRTFATLVDTVRHRPALVEQIYQRAAALDGTKEKKLDEYSRIVDVLAAEGTISAQNALLALLGDKEGKSEYQRHVTLTALAFTKYGAHSDVVDHLEHMAFNLFGNQTSQNVDLTDPIAAVAPVTLGTVVHFRHHIGHVDPNERKRTMELQDKLEQHARVALEHNHPKEHKLVWINALGNTGRNSSLSILSQYLKKHRGGQYNETEEHNDMVRAASVMALRQIPGNHSENLITHHLWDPSPKVREAAANVYASSHRQAGEGTAEKLHHAWLREKDGAVLSLLEKAKTKAGECKGCTEPKKFEASVDEIKIPYSKQWQKKFGSNPNYLALESGFKLQFVAPYVDAKAGLVMHSVGNDMMIIGVGIQAAPSCVNKKTKTSIVPYAIIFNQVVPIPLSKDTKKQVTLGKCSGDKESGAKPKTAKEIVAAHNKKKAQAIKDRNAKVGDKNFKKNELTESDGPTMEGSAGGKIVTPTCGPIELIDVWSKANTAPPAPLGRFMTAIGPTMLTIEIKITFTIGLEGQISSCGGGDFVKKPRQPQFISRGMNSVCEKGTKITDKNECSKALGELGLGSIKWTGAYWGIPSGCSYVKGRPHFNTHTNGRANGEFQSICRKPIIGDQCNAKNFIDTEEDCFGDAIEAAGLFPTKAKTVHDSDKPKGCSYYGGLRNNKGKQDKAVIYFNTHKNGRDNADYAAICTVDAADNKRDPYVFMGAIAPYFSIGLELSAGIGWPFILKISVTIAIEFFKLQPVTTLTAAGETNLDKDIPAMISAGDFYVHLLAGSVSIDITFLPDIFDFVINLIKIQFPGPNGKYACVSGIGTKPCPDEWFINAPGPANSPLSLSAHPVNLWCTNSPKEKSMCPWASGRKSDDDTKSDQSLNLARGKCKQSFHCQGLDFDGYVMNEHDSITSAPYKRITWRSSLVFRDMNNYRSESDHKWKKFNKKFGTELVAGVDRPIQSYVVFEASGLSPIQTTVRKDWCLDQKAYYNVKPGITFGSLPKSKQSTWTQYNCDAIVLQQNSCGRVVLRGTDPDNKSSWNDAYVFSFGGGKNGESSIARARVSGSYIHTLKNKKSDIPEFNVCNQDESFSFWVRVDTYGHAAMGTGGKVGVNTLLQWHDPDPAPIQWVRMAGFGSSSNAIKIKFTNVEVNRGYKEEVYCYPTNSEEDPDKKEFNDLGTCYRKMPDSYHSDHNVRTNPQSAPQLKCNKGSALLDKDHEACISGVCRDFGIGVFRCTGCNDDRDCGKRTYIGKDCNAPGTSVIIRKSNGYYYGATVQDFDGSKSNGYGAPNNGKIRVKGGKFSGIISVYRFDAWYCPHNVWNYNSATLPADCRMSCAVGGTQCPIERPSSAGLEPAACWDGSHQKGNRGVCSKEERDHSRWGPRKFFCREKGFVGAWCDKDEHCLVSGSACIHWLCSKPKKDMEICGQRASHNNHAAGKNAECASGHCRHWWGTDWRCEPKGGWPKKKDMAACSNNNECASGHCRHSGQLKIESFYGAPLTSWYQCEPNGGWPWEYVKNFGDLCSDSKECKSHWCKHHYGTDSRCYDGKSWRSSYPPGCVCQWCANVC